MAKLIFAFFLIGCATSNKKGDVNMNISMRDNLYATQNYYEVVKKLKDPLFEKLVVDKCLLKWEEEVNKLKDQVKKAKDRKQRVDLWYQLGNCYNYVGDFKLTFYYYDLVLSEEKKNAKRKAVISYNLGQIYQNSGSVALAQSYYEDAYRNDRLNLLAQLQIALIYLEQGAYQRSIRSISSVLAGSSTSSVARFILGINYFHLKDFAGLNSKVLNRLTEKSTERTLLQMALNLETKKDLKGTFEDLKGLELDFPLFKKFQSYLLKKYGNSINEET